MHAHNETADSAYGDCHQIPYRGASSLEPLVPLTSRFPAFLAYRAATSLQLLNFSLISSPHCVEFIDVGCYASP